MIEPEYKVSRLDGRDGPGGDHDGCDLFVLDITHDPCALVAIQAYANACYKLGQEDRAQDLAARLLSVVGGPGRGDGIRHSHFQ